MGTTSWIVPGSQTIEVGAVGAVRVQLIGGRATVVAGDVAGARVEIGDVSGHPVEVRHDGPALSVGYPFLGWDGWLKRLHSYRAKDAAMVRVVVPAGTGLKVGTVLADVDIAGLSEDVSVGTASGAVRIANGHGSADVKTVAGSVAVENHDGAVRINSVSGAVVARGALPRAEVSTVSGAVEVLTTLASSVISVSTVSARVSVDLPARSGLVLTARSVSGKVLVDGADLRTAGITSLDEKVDDAGCWLSTNTVSADVEVRRGPVRAGVADEAEGDSVRD
jgi:hypothetical protein